uniref:Uncharacterized protein n=1 Tax=viral metagenome TaxID=1070528 RepID=A0A6C0LLL3_9ZZZZ
MEQKEIVYLNEDPGFDKIMEITGGYFTTLHLQDGGTIFLREDGEYTCKINKTATELFKINIYGRIVIINSSLHDSE